MYLPKYFKLYELIPAEFHQKAKSLKDRIKLWWCLDGRILRTADVLRERYGKLICNDWYWRTSFNSPEIHGNEYRGWRPPNCPVGAVMSSHKWGRALDLIPLECTVEEIRNDIINNPTSFKYIKAIEMEVPWLHIDCRSWYENKILKIYP